MNPAKVIPVCVLFLAVVYLTRFADLALSLSVILAVFIFPITSVWPFVFSLFSFAVHIILIFLKLKFDFILDLSVSSYIVFAAGLIKYFREGPKDSWEITLPFIHKIFIKRDTLFKIGGILILILFIYPLSDGYLALILGYLAFCFLFKKSDGRFAFFIALFFLVLCPFLLIAKKDMTAQISAIFTYYFLVIGTLQEIINLVRNPSKFDMEIETREKENEVSEYKPFLDSRNGYFQIEYHRTSKKKKKKWVFVLFLGAVLFGVLGFALPFRSPPQKAKPKDVVAPVLKIVTATPSVSIKEEMAGRAAKLKVLVANGTKIDGLAASTSAVLKKSGFTDIGIANADRSDYPKWEVSIKNMDSKLVQYLTQELSLKEPKIIEASQGAQFDVTIKIGMEK